MSATGSGQPGKVEPRVARIQRLAAPVAERYTRFDGHGIAQRFDPGNQLGHAPNDKGEPFKGGDDLDLPP
jgi:hypothetical protein